MKILFCNCWRRSEDKEKAPQFSHTGASHIDNLASKFINGGGWRVSPSNLAPTNPLRTPYCSGEWALSVSYLSFSPPIHSFGSTLSFFQSLASSRLPHKNQSSEIKKKRKDKIYISCYKKFNFHLNLRKRLKENSFYIWTYDPFEI